MDEIRAGSTVHYVLRPDWGLGRVRWITPAGLLHCRFEGVDPCFEGEFSAGELEDAAPLTVAA